MSFVILVSTDSTYTTSTASVFTLDFTPNPALKVNAVVNNCGASTTDSREINLLLYLTVMMVMLVLLILLVGVLLQEPLYSKEL